MRPLLGLALTGLLLASCTPKIHPAFTYNRYVKDFNTYIINDSLKVYHKAYGDINYLDSEIALKEQLKGSRLTGVLTYGLSNISPYYEYYLLLNPNKRALKKVVFDFQKDSLIGEDHYIFLGKGKEDAFPESDFDFISGSLRAGEDFQSNVTSLNDILGKYRNSNRYLKAWKEIMAYRPADRNEEGTQLQMALTYLSMLGKSQEYKAALKKWEGNHQPDTSIQRTINQRAISGFDKVRKTILDLSASERLLMFNENHFYPEHRILLDSLLPSLKARGFNYLALEGLHNDSLINLGKPLKPDAGFYTKEPHFHRLIKKAQQLGFTFVAYDFWEPGQGREEGQAINLYEKTFGQDPEAKVVVLAGISHITEKPDSRDKVWMAQLFNEKYGINPLTFSQTLLSRYRHTADQQLLLISSEAFRQRYLTVVDYHIINSLPWENSGGQYVLENGQNLALQFCLFDVEVSDGQFFYENSVPDYAFLLKPGDTVRLNVNPDDYQLVIFDENGQRTTNNE